MKPHDIDAGPWCKGFYAAMKLKPSAWAPLTLRNLDINHAVVADPVPLRQRSGAPDVMRHYCMPIRFRSRQADVEARTA
jgi:hypothetical protein